MYRIGIAGCGWAGTRHYEAVTDDERAEVVAIADVDPETRSRYAETRGTEATFGSYESMFDEADLDVAIIALPHDLHEDAVVRAARLGLDILCEKPIARTVAEADRMLDAAEKGGVRLVVAESARYERWVRALEDGIADGSVGHPVFASYNWLHDFGTFEYERSEWLNDPRRLGGGSWLLNGVHFVSSLRGWFDAGGAGKIETVVAREYRSDSFDAPDGIEASTNFFLAFEGGESATVSLGLEVPSQEMFNDVRIHGTDGTAIVDHDRTEIRFHSNGSDVESVPVGGDDTGYRAQLNEFLDSLEHGSETRTEGIRERNTLAVIEAGYRSLETERTCNVEHRRAT